MRIALSGVQCTGKTTILEEMKKCKEFEKFTFVKECIRDLQKKGILINEQGNDETQMAIMNVHIANLSNDNCVFDRCVLDCVSYAKYSLKHGKITEKTYNECVNCFNEFIDCYDYLVYLVPEFKMIDDGTRSTNEEFRNEVKCYFDEFIKDIEKNHDTKVIRLHGTVKERMEQLMEGIF